MPLWQLQNTLYFLNHCEHHHPKTNFSEKAGSMHKSVLVVRLHLVPYLRRAETYLAFFKDYYHLDVGFFLLFATEISGAYIYTHI